jgi:hypothetical protein
VPLTSQDATDRHRKPRPQFAVRRADAPFPVRRRRHHERNRRRSPDQLLLCPHRAAKKEGKQLAFETEWTQDRIEENWRVNRIRQRVAIWREGRYPGVTPTTARLLQYWTDPTREKKLFFRQIEALETAIYITEAARRYGDAWIENELREANDQSNPGLPWR